MKKRRPIIIAFEGHDGSGKSLQVASLKSFLKKQGLSVSHCEFHDRHYAKSIIRNITTNGVLNSIAVSACMAISFMATLEAANHS